jgi:hypothetical protein
MRVDRAGERLWDGERSEQRRHEEETSFHKDGVLWRILLPAFARLNRQRLPDPEAN